MSWRLRDHPVDDWDCSVKDRRHVGHVCENNAVTGLLLTGVKSRVYFTVSYGDKLCSLTLCNKAA